MTKAVLYENGLTLRICIPDSANNEENGLPQNINEYSIKKLEDMIDYSIPAFFSLNCFGTRSTKGWGSYGVVLDNDRKKKRYVYLGEFQDVFYRLSINRNIKEESKPEIRIMLCDLLSKMMKGGNNFHGYYKGRIFTYYLKKGIGNDKAFVKQKILKMKNESKPDSEANINYNDFKYVRGLLGLPAYNNAYVYKKRNVSIECTTEGNEENIKRFNNPVHFVLNKDNVLIIPTEIPEAIKGAEFFFFEDSAKDKDHQSICIPDEFNIEDFLDYFRREINEVDTSKFNKPPLDLLNIVSKEKNERIIKYKGGEKCE